MSKNNNRFANALMRALEKKNLDGFDYLEFKQSVTRLTETGMDLDTAINSAFITGSSMGLTKEKLVKTANYYAEVLQDEKAQFMRSLEKHLVDNVEGKSKQSGELKKKIANWETKIKQLQEQIAAARKQIDSADSQIEAARTKAEENQRGFEEALQTITNTIREDVEHIQRIIS
jgi:chromosome segregation ATPase